jgi:hypothetical protein
MICSYRLCNEELPYGLNGNRRYCNDECNYLERLEREKEKNAKKKTALSEINRVGALLRSCHRRYMNKPFDINVLREQKMNWTLISYTSVVDGLEYRIVGSFGYAALDNGTIKIEKF